MNGRLLLAALLLVACATAPPPALQAVPPRERDRFAACAPTLRETQCGPAFYAGGASCDEYLAQIYVGRPGESGRQQWLVEGGCGTGIVGYTPSPVAGGDSTLTGEAGPVPGTDFSSSGSGTNVDSSGGAGGGSVHVRGYTRSNGTYVAPHYRSAPGHGRR